MEVHIYIVVMKHNTSAAIARGLIDSSPGIGTMATIYPSDHPTLAG